MLISRRARQTYQFEEDFFHPDGRVHLMDYAAARRFAGVMSAGRLDPIPASDIQAMAILDEVLRILLRQYDLQNPGVLKRGLAYLQSSLGEEAEASLVRFRDEFPPRAVYAGDISASDYLWTFITLIPVMNVVPIGNIMAERYLYIPSWGFCMFLGILILKTHSYIIHTYRPLVKSCFILILIFYCVFTIKHSRIWTDEQTLWFHTVNNNSCSFNAHNNLGKEYFQQGLIDKAIEEYTIALSKAAEVHYAYPTAHYNLGIAYDVKGRYNDAIREYKNSLRIDPGNSDAHNNLGIAFFKNRQADSAICSIAPPLPEGPCHSIALFLCQTQYSFSVNSASQAKLAVNRRPSAEIATNRRKRGKKNCQRKSVAQGVSHGKVTSIDQDSRLYVVRRSARLGRCFHFSASTCVCPRVLPIRQHRGQSL